MNVNILYEDAHIFVVVKPPGMPSQAERSTAVDMVSYLKNLLARRDKVANPYVAVVHRLDRPVGGVMVYAKTPTAAANLSAQVSSRGVQKEYLAVLCGTLPNPQGHLEHYLRKDGRTNTSEVVATPEMIATQGSVAKPGAVAKRADGKRPDYKSAKGQWPDGKRAALDYTVLDMATVAGNIYTLVDIRLETGRHHQIRVQMAAAGAPVAGDTKYGTGGGFREMGLFSRKLVFKHPVSKKGMEFSAVPHGRPFDIFAKAQAAHPQTPGDSSCES